VDERVRRAAVLYEQAVFAGAVGQLAVADWELDAAEADLAMARGQLMHARFLLRSDQDPAAVVEDAGELPLFERAVELYRALGDTSGEVLGRLLSPGRPPGQRDRGSGPRAVSKPGSAGRQ
jgi:hypothetical protein